MDIIKIIKKSINEFLNESDKYEDKELNKPFRTPDGPKKFAVYVKDGEKVKKVTFGDPNMEIRRDNPKNLKSYRARHGCDDEKDKTTANYWSCQMWRDDKSVTDILED
jgi:hypothetical protein